MRSVFIANDQQDTYQGCMSVIWLLRDVILAKTQHTTASQTPDAPKLQPSKNKCQK